MKRYHELRNGYAMTAIEAYKQAKLTREQWLKHASELMQIDLFGANGYSIDAKYRVSCGLPSKGAFSSKLRRIGEAWHNSASKDGTCEIFISPTIADSELVLSTLAHELVHVCVGNDKGHGPVFKKCATAIGLEGKMTATVAGEELKAWCASVVDALGRFPHAELDKSEQKKQSTRMLKAACPNGFCQYSLENPNPYVLRGSAKVFNAGVPNCPCCGSQMEVEQK